MTKAELQKKIADLEKLLAISLEENALLKTKITELEKRLGLNSSNSSKPPSSDGLGKKLRTQSLRNKGKNSTGGQKGHKGRNLSQVAQPDKVMNHQVIFCPECSKSLEAVEAAGTIRRQVFDIPPMAVHVTEHQAEVKTCDQCQTRVVATFPEGVNAPVQYGERIKAMAVYLNHQQLIPEDRVQDVFCDLFDLQISTATIVKMGEALAAKVAPYIEAVKDYLKGAPVKHADETGFRIGGHTRWLHVLCNDKATVYVASQRRNDIAEGLKGVVCHDYFRPYFRLKGVKHALCNAHILRELKALIEHEREPWAQQMSRLLAFAGQIAKDGVKIRRYKWRLAPLYDEIVERGLVYHEGLAPLPQKRKGKPKRRDGHNLLLRLKGHKEDVLRCLDLSVPGVPFTNNQAEQDIRMMKVKQKISGGFRTMEGAETFATIRSFLSTMRKQGHNLFEAITTALSEQPTPLTAFNSKKASWGVTPVPLLRARLCEP